MAFVLVGCSRPYSNGYVHYIHDLGPNDIECNSFYHYIRVEKGLNQSGLQRYDLITEKDQDIFISEDPDNQKVTSYWGDDDEVYYVVITYQEGDDEKVLYHYDLHSETCETMMTTEGYLDVSRDVITNKIKVITDEQNYFIEDGELQQIDPSDEISSGFSSSEDIVRIVSDDGTIIELYKQYKQSEFTYNVDGISHEITALSDCGGEKSGLSNFFVIEGDKVIGIVQIVKNGRNGIIPCNIIRYDDLKKEILVSIDYKTGESEILYDTQKNTIRIVGYSNGNVYLLNGSKIICKDLADGSEKEMCSLSNKGNKQLSFSWVGSKLIVFDEYNLQVIANIQT
jgi:hypothetical protein